jgi:hypothetical protein
MKKSLTNKRCGDDTLDIYRIVFCKKDDGHFLESDVAGISLNIFIPANGAGIDGALLNGCYQSSHNVRKSTP